MPSELPELIGLITAFVILLITFGAPAAAGMPILTAVLGVVISLMGITALASVINIASASTTVAIMLGLSCGVDYGLFILFRHRNQVLQGMELDESVGLARRTNSASPRPRIRRPGLTAAPGRDAGQTAWGKFSTRSGS